MFVSGTTYQLLQLGQPLDDVTAGIFFDTAADPVPVQPPQDSKRKLSVAVKPSNSNHSGERSSPAGSTKTGGSKGGPSLMDLIDSGLLQPGYDNMKVTYKGNTYAGALQGNGTILFRGTTFNTPSAFSVHVKRLITPNKQGDDGWHSVYVDGVLLNSLRQQYHAKLLGQPYTHHSNKIPRRSHSSPRGQQQQQQYVQQQQQVQHLILPQQQLPAQQALQQQQQQPVGQRPPLPMPKLKLGNIKGLPSMNPNHAQSQQQPAPQQQQQQLGSNGVLQSALPQDQVQSKPHKLKFKMKLGKPTGDAAAAAAAAGGTQQVAAARPAAAQQQQQEMGVHCILDPHQPVSQAPQAPAQQQQQAAEAGPPHWVRCCRCEQLRFVPEGCWDQVQAVGVNWFCEDAGWDVKQQQPYTDACMPDVWADTPDEGLMVPAI